MKAYKLYLCVEVFCDELTEAGVEICSDISTQKMLHHFGDTFVIESKFKNEQSVLQIEFGIDNENPLPAVDEILLELSEEWADHLKKERGLNLSPEVDFSVRLVACDFTSMIYQSYADGEYDSGHLAGGDEYEGYLRDVIKQVSSRKNSVLKTWIESV